METEGLSVVGVNGVLAPANVKWMIENSSQCLVAKPWFQPKIFFDGRPNARYADLANEHDLLGIKIAAMGLLFSPLPLTLLCGEQTDVKGFLQSSTGNEEIWSVLVSMLRPLGFGYDQVVLRN